MFVYNRQHPMGVERFPFAPASAALNAEIAANRAGFHANEDQLATRRIGNALPLPKDVWGLWDTEAVALQRTLLAVFADLAGSVSMPMPLGKLVHHFQQISDSGQVTTSLDGRPATRTDKPVYTYVGTPLPIFYSEFGFGWREVEAARTEGIQLDAAARLNANRKILEKLENIALDGDSTIVVGGATLYGLRTHPKRNTRTTAQALNGATGAQWLADVVATLKLLHGDGFKTPATVYLNWDDWFYANATEFATGYPKTIAQRVLELAGIREIIPADSITAGQIIAVIKDRSTVQVLNGMPVNTQAQFRANPQDEYKFLTWAAAAVEIKYDAADKCGVAVSSL